MSIASLYRIHVIAEGRQFRLCNHGVTCGPRMVKGGSFPFTKSRWWILDDKESADAAAERLQEYLEHCEKRRDS